MTQGERVREIRKSLNLTLEQFGNRIGLKKNSISQIENGRNKLTAGNALAICREYNVNDCWLRTGAGKMFSESDVSDLIETHERIRELRKNHLKMSQTVFGEYLGVNRDVINNIENNRLSHPEQKLSLYKLICKEFNVNEEWLRTGRGKIFAEQNTLDAFAKAHEASKTEIALFKAFLCIEPTVRQTMLEQFKINLNQLKTKE